MKKKITKKHTKLQEAIKTLTRALRKDSGYRIAWQANIAMAFYDEVRSTPSNKRSNKNIHTIANKAADNFLNLLCRK